MVDVAYLFKNDPNFKEVIYYYAFPKLTKKHLSCTKVQLWILYKQLLEINNDIVITIEKFVELLIYFNKYNNQRKKIDYKFLKLLSMNITQSLLGFYLANIDDYISKFLYQRIIQGHRDTDKSLRLVYENMLEISDDKLNEQCLEFFSENKEYLFLILHDRVENCGDDDKKFSSLRELILFIKDHNIKDQQLMFKLIEIQFAFMYIETSPIKLVSLYLELINKVPAMFLPDIHNRMTCTNGEHCDNIYDSIVLDYEYGLYDSRFSKLEQDLQADQILNLRKKAIKFITDRLN